MVTVKRDETGKFVKGSSNPWNKGKPAPWVKTHFKKGHKVFGGIETRFKKGHKSFLTEKSLKKMSEATRGIKNPFYNKKHTKQSKIKIREFQINNPNRVFKDTSIELKIETELQRRKINYQKQVPLCKIARVDFYLPEYRIVIQCDGDYWHNKPEQKIRDEQQDKVLTFNGFNVYRFWEHEINNSVKNCISKII